MESRATAVKPSAPASGEADASAADAGHGQIEAMIASEIPAELQACARDLLRAVTAKVAVAEHFDAFCGQAFSKPEWAAAASPLIAELFEDDEDLLAELARIPDLVIEMGSGQVTVTCMVASRWAARGETHRLSRLAESIVASHASKNACAVDVMLALAATLAVTRFSKAEQLYNAALPLAGDEHQEALADARRWLAAGRVVCGASQEERDFWDVRLRKPKTAWTWQGGAERAALDTLSEGLSDEGEGADLFKAIVPACWWDMAMKCARQQEKLAVAAKLQALAKPEPPAPPRFVSEFAAQERMPSQTEQSAHPRSGSHARFVLGWVCGAMAMAITVFLLPAELVNRVLGTFKAGNTPATAPAAVSVLPREPAAKQAWREENLKKIAAEMAQYSAQHAAAKALPWSENEKLLSGQGVELPDDSPQHLKMLVWLHLDPPRDAETRLQVARLLLQKMKADAITLWEMLAYPGSPNAGEISRVAGEALSEASHPWSGEEGARLRLLADGAEAKSDVSAAAAAR